MSCHRPQVDIDMPAVVTFSVLGWDDPFAVPISQLATIAEGPVGLSALVLALLCFAFASWSRVVPDAQTMLE